MTYKILPDQIIGEGEQGKVYLTKKETEEECNYVTKIPVSSSEVHIGKIASENKIGPKVFEVYENNKGKCLVMEKLTGMTLEDFIKKDIYLNKELSISLVNKILKLHKLGWIHRDLCSQNIFVIMKEEIPVDFKIIDFGLSEKLHDINNIKDVRDLYLSVKHLAIYNMENLKELIETLKTEVDKRRKKPTNNRKMKKRKMKKRKH